LVEMKDTSNHELTPLYARLLGPLIRPFPNFDVCFVKSLRQTSVRQLQLTAGNRVLDAGCGTGGSFPYLVAAVTPMGSVTGVEISRELAMHAEERVRRNGWTNVRVIAADAKTIKLQGSFDALLMLGAPDVYASEAALANLLPYLKDGARVFAFGAKFSRRRLAKALNPVLGWMFSEATFPTTPKLDFEPWKTLEACGASLTIEEHVFGFMFYAWGSISAR
jgi:cyclopropane fatty-acyl-phospholipid synthase-like methyltransferase